VQHADIPPPQSDTLGLHPIAHKLLLISRQWEETGLFWFGSTPRLRHLPPDRSIMIDGSVIELSTFTCLGDLFLWKMASLTETLKLKLGKALIESETVDKP